ncbi:MAG: lysine--tRNA ligase [Acidobacteriota bacterium]|nr:MAG: lysine--tRNA ligase [Acidobacteriota bacterium]
MSIPDFEQIIEQNDQTAARAEHLDRLRELVGNVYPNKFERSRLSGGEDTISAIKAFGPVVEIEAQMAAIKAELKEGERPPAEKKDEFNESLKAVGTVRIAGRLTTPPRGNFVHLTDGISKLQVYANKKGPLAVIKNDGEGTLDEENGWTAWQLLDHGDFIGVEGYLFVTNTGEVSVHIEKLQFLAKAMLPMPDKMHGIEDPEIKQRRRYIDLIGSSLAVEHDGLTTREVFERRAKLISSIRHYLEDHGYIEVETPMLTPKATGAAAKPFKTHHNALDIDLYARIAPELYLKRLVVGGFEKVYELNRNFRNEGISYKHNPEFTMLEFYCAYMDVNGMMDFCEELLRQSVLKATGGLTVDYKGKQIDFSEFERISMREAIVRHFPGADVSSLTVKHLIDWRFLRRMKVFQTVQLELGNMYQLNIAEGQANPYYKLDESVKGEIWEKTRLFEVTFPSENQLIANGFGQGTSSVFRFALGDEMLSESNIALTIATLFERYAEANLIQPTFIIDFPKSISPLSKASPDNPQIAERFELFINGMEVANGFSELNDPKEQYDRFVDQMAQREKGDEEAMVLDEDYVRALSYGMPPAAGIGIGIDRLTMLLTNRHSIRDVILFPHMRPEKQFTTEETESTEEVQQV